MGKILMLGRRGSEVVVEVEGGSGDEEEQNKS